MAFVWLCLVVWLQKSLKVRVRMLGDQIPGFWLDHNFFKGTLWLPFWTVSIHLILECLFYNCQPFTHFVCARINFHLTFESKINIWELNYVCGHFNALEFSQNIQFLVYNVLSLCWRSGPFKTKRLRVSLIFEILNHYFLFIMHFYISFWVTLEYFAITTYLMLIKLLWPFIKVFLLIIKFEIVTNGCNW